MLNAAQHGFRKSRSFETHSGLSQWSQQWRANRCCTAGLQQGIWPSAAPKHSGETVTLRVRGHFNNWIADLTKLVEYLSCVWGQHTQRNVNKLEVGTMQGSENCEKRLWKNKQCYIKNSKWVWSGNTTITNCRQTRGIVRKSHTTITRHQKVKQSKATSYLFPIQMIAKLEWTKTNA